MWVILDLLVNGIGIDKFQIYVMFSLWEDFYRYERVLYGKGIGNMVEGDLDDFFMMYLNFIEQIVFKFKLQVEQVKVDILEVLKVKLEKVYEGMFLEDILLKFREKF